MSAVKTTSCNWCLREAPVQTIEDKLWRFWSVISNEDPLNISLNNICEECKLRYEKFSRYTERWKSNESVVTKVLTSGKVKDEFSVDMGYPIIKEEISVEEVSDFAYTIGSVNKGRGDVENMALSGSTDDQGECETSLMCSFCDKHFSSSYCLKVHLLVHVSDKPFKCLYCKAAFAWSGSLIRHLRIHTGEKPSQCSFCNNIFQSDNLEAHLLTHANDKPLKCSQCNKGFAKSGNLINHLRIHISEKPFKRLQCNKTYGANTIARVSSKSNSNKYN